MHVGLGVYDICLFFSLTYDITHLQYDIGPKVFSVL